MCECIKTVNENLLKAGHNARISVPLMLGGGVPRPQVVTEKADRAKRMKPVSVFASYCPFCAVKYEAAQ